MTLKERIAKLEQERAARLQLRATKATALEAIREKLDAGEAGVTLESVKAAIAERAAVDAEIRSQSDQIEEMKRELADDEAMQRLQSEVHAVVPPVPAQRGAGGYENQVRTGQEPRTYTQETARGGVSFFQDMYRSTTNPMGSPSQKERLERHMTEVRVEGESQQRATTTSSFAGLIPPKYLTDQAALLARAGRPTANIVQHLPLPDEGMSLIIPRGTTGASEAIQATENANVSSTDEVWANVTVPVVTIAGQQDVSRQSLERGTPGIDQLIYMDLAGAYAVALDQQVLSGTGSSGQMLGILQTSGINQATAFGAAVTIQTFYTKLAGQLNAVETTRFFAPDVIIMHPRRWNWLLSQLDTQNRPFIVPNMNGPFNAMGVSDVPQDTPATTPVGWLFGLPVITDASVPVAVGTGPEDQVIVARWEDLILWEDGDGMPRDLRFEQTLGNQLTVKLVAYGYSAFTAGRYPTAVGVVGGNSASTFGLVAPTF